jgi:UDP-glucose 6-dehydrogenase
LSKLTANAFMQRVSSINAKCQNYAKKTGADVNEVAKAIGI